MASLYDLYGVPAKYAKGWYGGRTINNPGIPRSHFFWKTHSLCGRAGRLFGSSVILEQEKPANACKACSRKLWQLSLGKAKLPEEENG